MRASTLPRRRRKCSTGCPVLDRALDGGVPCGSVTELVGESGAAKTQLCLQLSLAVQLPSAPGGPQGSSLYVFTEHYFPFSRLRQMSACFLAGEARSPGEGRADKRLKLAGDSCRNVFVQGVQTAQSLLEFLDTAESILSRGGSSPPVRLLIVDSIAALFRADFDPFAAQEMTARSALFFQISAKLKKLAADYDLAVVVANQVVDRLDSAADPDGFEALMTSGRRVAPALGMGWAHCVNTRLFLSRTVPPLHDWRGAVRRAIGVVFAPHLPNASCEFAVDERGVRGVASGEMEAVECLTQSVVDGLDAYPSSDCN